jgi:hypothetical protein
LSSRTIKAPPTASRISTELSYQKLSTETESNPTMNAPLNAHAFTLMSLFNNAITTHETDEILFATTLDEGEAQTMITRMYITNRDIDTKIPGWEAQYKDQIEIMKQQTFNSIIRKLYDYGQALRNNPKKNRRLSKEQNDALFIYDYFQGVPKAIQFLREVTLDNIRRTLKDDRATMIRLRRLVVENHNSVVQRPPNFGTDDLWRVMASDDEDALFTPPPSSKRPRHNSKPPSAAHTATELFTRDITSPNSDVFFTTEELEGYFGPSSLTRKRKLTPEHLA